MTVSKRWWKRGGAKPDKKVICFDCRKYIHIIDHKCSECGSTEACSIGRNFRAPRQSKINAWKELHSMWKVLRAKNLEMANNGKPPLWGIDHFIGFGGGSYAYNLKLPKSVKERGFREELLSMFG